MNAKKWLLPLLLLGLSTAQAQDSSYRFFMKLPGHTSDVESVAFSFDGKMMASGGWDNRIMVYRADTPGIGQLLFTLEGHYAAITTLAFSRDGKMLASGSKDFSVKVWDLTLGRLITTFSQHTDAINRVYFDNTGKNVMTCSNDGTMQILDIARVAKPKVLKVGQPVNAFVQHPDRKSFLVATNGPEILQVDPTGKVLKRLAGHTDQVNIIQLSADNKTLISCSHDKTVIVWDVMNGKVLRTLKGHNWKVTSVIFSADGRYIVSGGNDGEARVWETATGIQLALMKGICVNVRGVSLSPNQTRLVIGGYLPEGSFGVLIYETPLVRLSPTPAKPAPGKPGTTPDKPATTPAKPGNGTAKPVTTPAKPTTTPPAKP
jgi:WD40 repeat protein